MTTAERLRLGTKYVDMLILRTPRRSPQHDRSAMTKPCNEGDKCAREDCIRPRVARGLCRSHYNRWYGAHRGEVQSLPRRRKAQPYSPEPCEVADCENIAVKYRRHCTMHHARQCRHGSVDVVKNSLGMSLAERFAANVPHGLPDNICWEWRGALISGTGYGSCDGRGAHRVAYELGHGPIPGGMVVRHKCDNRPCVNPSHLELGTYSDNSRDMVDRGRCASGKRRWSEEQREWVRAAVAGGMSAAAAARHIGMSPQHARTLARQAS